MNLTRAVDCSALVRLIVICAVALSPGTSARDQPPVSAKQTAKAIDAILYGDFSREDILAKLKPYAAPMQSIEDVRKQLEFGLCFGSGPGVMQCRVAATGFSLVFDPDKKLRLIRRDARVVDGVSYPEMSITDRGFDWHGYRRWYQN